MRRAATLIFSCILFSAPVVAQNNLQKILDVIEYHGVYTQSNNTLVVLDSTANHLHLEIADLFNSSLTESEMIEVVRRNMIHHVYLVFTYSDTEAVTLTSRPLVHDRYTGKVVAPKPLRHTIYLNRKDAIAMVQKYFNFTDTRYLFTSEDPDLKSPTYPSRYLEAMIYQGRGKPGLHSIYQELIYPHLFSDLK